MRTKVIGLAAVLAALSGCVSVSEEGIARFTNGEERIIKRNVTWIAGAKGEQAMQNLEANWTTDNGEATISSLQSTEGVTTPNTLASIVQLADLIAGMRVQLAEQEAELERQRIESGATWEQQMELLTPGIE